MYDKQQMIDIYNKYATTRNNSKIDEFKIREIEFFVDLIDKENKKTVLDIGCGTGEITSIFKKHNFDVLGIDFSESMLKYANEKNINTILLDCYHVDNLEKKFDAVFSINCLLHIPMCDIGLIFSKINEILDTNGLFYLGLWAGDDFEGIYEKDEYDKKRFFVFYKQKTLLNLVSDFFRIEYYHYIIAHNDIHFHSCILRKN